MKVIFTKTVEGVARLGEEKEVKPGFARNFLFPQNLATVMTDLRVKSLQAEYRSQTVSRDSQKKVVSELANTWKGQTFVIKARASDDGSLYGSVGSKEIRKLLGRDDIQFESPTLKKIGSHAIELAFTEGITVPITVVIEPDKRK